MEKSTIEMSPLQEHHLMELATLAIKARDTYKLDATDSKMKMQALLNEIERLKIQIEGREAVIRRLEGELEDEQSNNQMLQRMLKRLSKDK
jgi:hypothetical protein